MAKAKIKTKKESEPNYSLSQKLIALAELGRPIEWSKSLLNMVLATMMAAYIYLMPVNATTFFFGFLAVAALWSGLYALNDYTDWRIDKIHPTKKNRPIPSGKVSPRQGFVFSISLILISFIISFALNNFLLLLCLLIMLTNQLLYTTKPYRLKSRKFFDVISGSMVNPFFRYFSGLVLFVPGAMILSQTTPILPIIFVVGIQFSGYSLYRLFSTSHDKKVKMKSSFALLSEKLIKRVSHIAMGIAGLAYLLLIVNGTFFRINWLGWLPLQFLGTILIALCFTPLLKMAVKDPSKANMKTSYRAVYVMNIAFVAGNIIIFSLFP